MLKKMDKTKINNDERVIASPASVTEMLENSANAATKTVMAEHIGEPVRRIGMAEVDRSRTI